jgi:hypothetical protein
LASSDGAGFGVIVYGWSEYESYGYPGGLCFAKERPSPPCTNCPPAILYLDADSNCVAQVPDLTLQIRDCPAAISIQQNPPAGTLVGLGTHPITVTIIDRFGQHAVCHSALTVLPGEDVRLRCSPNIVTNCTTAEGAIVNYPPPVMCGTNYVVECIPPSGSLFRVGTTQVLCVAKRDNVTLDQCWFTVTVNCERLSITQTQEGFALVFPADGTLLVAPSLTGPWLPVQGVTSPYIVPIRAREQAFYRLVRGVTR